MGILFATVLVVQGLIKLQAYKFFEFNASSAAVLICEFNILTVESVIMSLE